MIQSPYSITLTPDGGTAAVLVAEGGWLDGLPTFEASQDLFESDGVQLAHGFFRPLGNAEVIIQITVEADHATLVHGLEALLDADLADAASLLQVGGTLTFTPAGGGAATEFPDAVITAITPDLPSGPSATTVRTISIRAGVG